MLKDIPMKKRFALIAPLLTAVCMGAAGAPALAETSQCAPLPGAETLIERTDLDYIIMGEMHGTAELPAAFADLVCLSALKGPVTVGVEFLPAEQTALDAYLSSTGDEAARTALLASEGWGDPYGRASHAILALIERLRQIKAGGADLTVVAFDHPSETPGTSAAREAGMAQLLLDARQARPDARVVALTGNGHAGKSAWTSFDPPFPAMSQLLPDARTVAVTYVRGGGEVWACRAPSEGAAEECHVWPSTARDAIPARGLAIDSSRNGFEAIVSVGQPFTASTPARSAR
jgi:hypothetical protein